MNRPIIPPPWENIGLVNNAQQALADGDAGLIEQADKAVAVRPIGPYIRLRCVSGSPSTSLGLRGIHVKSAKPCIAPQSLCLSGALSYADGCNGNCVALGRDEHPRETRRPGA